MHRRGGGEIRFHHPADHVGNPGILTNGRNLFGPKEASGLHELDVHVIASSEFYG